jgi:predicted RNase H-like HicB family nuclease
VSNDQIATVRIVALISSAEEGGYTAIHRETGTTTQGETVDDALANLQEAVALWYESMSTADHADGTVSTARRAIGRTDYEAFIQESSERLRYQVEFSQSALRNLHLVNGGAIIALLTVVGNSVIEYDVRSLWWAFLWFGVGLVASLSAYFGAYFSQANFMNVAVQQAWNAQATSHDLPEPYSLEPEMSRGNIALWGGIGAALTGLASFIIGAFVALGGIL